MKKILLIGLIVALALVIVGGAGVAYAQFRGMNRNTFTAVNRAPSGDVIIRQFGNGPGGMMGGNAYGLCSGGGDCEYGHDEMMDGFGYGPGGMMGGNGPRGMMGGNRPRGMMDGLGFAQGEGPMHDYMISAFADAIGLTTDEVETRLENGETLREIAIAQGKPEADLPDLITQVRQTALDQAVAGGVITQAQAELMLEHMSNYEGPGFGPGYGHEDCPMWDEQQQP